MQVQPVDKPKWRLFIALLGLVFFLLAPVETAVAQAKDIPVSEAARVSGDSEKTRFVADLSFAVGYNVYVLPRPYRVMIDLPEVAFKLPEGAGQKAQGLIEEFRFGLLEPGRSRIVLQTTGPVLISKSFVLPAEDGQPARIVVDLVKTDVQTFGDLYKTDAPVAPPPPDKSERLQSAAKTDEGETTNVLSASVAPEIGLGGDDQALAALPLDSPVPLPRVKPGREGPEAASLRPTKPIPVRPVVVIDPGHGGVDPGAISKRTKTREKDIVLKFSHVLAKKLRASGKYQVYLTRSDDRFLTLRDRVKFARDKEANLFIAIHADSLKRGSASGATVYTLSDKASDDEAAALARQENQADIINGVDLEEENQEITGILIDLAQRESKNHSVYFAKKVVDSFRNTTKLHRRPLRSAGFRVLKAPDVPSILLELGYLSSRSDEKKLRSPKWRSKVAASLTKAIDRYFSVQFAANGG